MGYGQLTRRSFIGAAVAAIPGVRIAAAMLPFKDADLWITFAGEFPGLHFTTYYSGKIECRVFGKLLEGNPEGEWTRLGGLVNNWWVETRARRDDEGRLALDWFRMATTNDGSPVELIDDFGGWSPRFLA